MKVFAIATAVVMAIVTHAAVAGVTPNTATSAAARSGAKIKPVETHTEGDSQDNSSGQTGTTK